MNHRYNISDKYGFIAIVTEHERKLVGVNPFKYQINPNSGDYHHGSCCTLSLFWSSALPFGPITSVRHQQMPGEKEIY